MTNKNKNQQINKNNLVEIVIGLGKKKDDLRIQGMQNIHPMYEALIALLRKQLKDDEIKDTIIDEKSLRTALVTDVFLEWVKPSYQSNLKSLLKSGKPLKEIVDQAALQIAEGKRMQDGNILYRADGQNPDKFFMKALKKAKPCYIYIEKAELDSIKKRKDEIKKKNKIKKIVLAALAGFLITMGIYGIINYKKIYKDIKLYREMKKSEETTTTRVQFYFSPLESEIESASDYLPYRLEKTNNNI